VKAAEVEPASDAATVMAPATSAGLLVQASTAELPAATTTGTPEATSDATAASMVALSPPPRDIDATAGRSAALPATASCTHFTPAATEVTEPLPLADNTLTAWKITRLLTPVFSPPAMPEQCVPWPLSSAHLVLPAAQPVLPPVQVLVADTRPPANSR
jgi:hypothetical protein